MPKGARKRFGFLFKHAFSSKVMSIRETIDLLVEILFIDPMIRLVLVLKF
jgi:hypothetical protein